MTLDQLFTACDGEMGEAEVLETVEELKFQGLVWEIVGEDGQIHYVLTAQAEEMSLHELLCCAHIPLQAGESA